jgi:hypothetical protein
VIAKRIFLWSSGILAAGLVVLGALVGYGHPRHPPPLADGIQFSTAIRPNAAAMQSVQWTAALRRRFPGGSMEGALLLTLQQQGFSVSPARRMASYDWGGPVCVQTVSTIWTTDIQHRIATIDGRYFSGCL